MPMISPSLIRTSLSVPLRTVVIFSSRHGPTPQEAEHSAWMSRRWTLKKERSSSCTGPLSLPQILHFPASMKRHSTHQELSLMLSMVSPSPLTRQEPILKRRDCSLSRYLTLYQTQRKELH